METVFQRETTITQKLAQRGLTVVKTGDMTKVVQPSPSPFGGWVDNIDGKGRSYYENLNHFEFGKLLRKIVEDNAQTGQIREEDYKNKLYIGADLDERFQYLTRIGIINDNEDGSYSLVQNIDEFGHTLEWYVSELFRKELRAEVVDWGVLIEGYEPDFDVLAFLTDKLVYVEAKSGNPTNIERDHVKSFLRRSQKVADLAIFLVDTNNTQSLNGVVDGWNNNVYMWQIDRFFINAQPSIRTNIQECVKCYFEIQQTL